MFNIGGGELIAILIIALIVLGPDKLPDAVRRAGRLYGELRRMSSGFQAELRDVLDEPMREVRETTDLVKGTFTTGLYDHDLEAQAAEASRNGTVEPVPTPAGQDPAAQDPATQDSAAHDSAAHDSAGDTPDGHAGATQEPSELATTLATLNARTQGDIPVPLPVPAGPADTTLAPPGMAPPSSGQAPASLPPPPST